jgi:hypothetical protein
MPGKGRKKSTSKKNGKSDKNGNSNKSKAKGSKKTPKSSKRGGGKAKFSMDIFNEEAVNDAYYTCHNIMDVLHCRGFPWPDAQKKKKKGNK